jgi:uncharacterized OB-fold protein
MTAAGVPELTLVKCSTCHARFVPLDGPCPRCGAQATEPYTSPGIGKVLASTLLESPAPGWARPHPLALVEVEDGVRLLVIPDPPLPAPGTAVELRRDGEVYRCRPVVEGGAGRGEGDAPGAGATRPPFEPPR